MTSNLVNIMAGNKIGLTTAKRLLEKNLTMKEKAHCHTSEAKKSAYLEHINPVKAKLYNFINKCMNFAPDSDDIFQDALLKGFKYFDSFDRSKNFSTWLFTIANNLIKDHFRSKKTLLPLDQKLMHDGMDPKIACQVRDVYQAVGKLKPHHRRVFFLFYYNEFKITEISEITGLSQSSVKFILRQSRKRIKRILEVPQ